MNFRKICNENTKELRSFFNAPQNILQHFQGILVRHKVVNDFSFMKHYDPVTDFGDVIQIVTRDQ